MATNDQENNQARSGEGSMTTREAGERGGRRVSELVEKGKQAEQKSGSAGTGQSENFGERADQPRENRDSR